MGCCGSSQSETDLPPSSSSRHHIVNQQPVAQPEPVLHMAHQFSASPDSPPLQYPLPTSNYTALDDNDFSSTTGTMPFHVRQASASSRDQGKVVIAIDFVMQDQEQRFLVSYVSSFQWSIVLYLCNALEAYGSSGFSAGQVQQIMRWPHSLETLRKIPTCLLYDVDGRLVDWGLQAKNARLQPGLIRYEWFKLFLEPRALRDEPELDPRLPVLPTGKTPTDLITDFLRSLWIYSREEITRDMGAVVDLYSADVWLTVPAAWDARGYAMMRAAAIAAGLVQSAYPGDTTWRDPFINSALPKIFLFVMREVAQLTWLFTKSSPTTSSPISDQCLKIIGDPAQLEIAEIAARSGANCGSLFLDIRFRNLVKTLLVDHPSHCDAPSLAYFMNSFSEADKLTYAGTEDDDNEFYFTCFNIQDAADDPPVGLVNGQLGIPGRLLRQMVFDPVVDEVIRLIEKQLAASPPIDALLLVGGFSGSAYLKTRIEDRLHGKILTIARPPDCDTATLRGAAHYGLARRPLVSQLIVPRSYVMKVLALPAFVLPLNWSKVKLPAEPEDRIRRPGYVTYNDAGVEICENRLQYLVQRGAMLRKGPLPLVIFFLLSVRTHLDYHILFPRSFVDIVIYWRRTSTQMSLPPINRLDAAASTLTAFFARCHSWWRIVVGRWSWLGQYSVYDRPTLDAYRQRITTPFCKFSKTRDDSTFTATLYTFDSDASTDVDTARYADEAELRPVCDWRVDLRGLRGWSANGEGGFYTDFEIGLEVDGGAVGGTLIYQQEECGRVVFDFQDHTSAPSPMALSRASIVAALSPIAISQPRWRNWGRTFHCSPAVVFKPTTIEECQLVIELARRDRRVVRAVGVGHSPSDIACTTDYMMDITGMNKILEVNVEENYVVAEAGIMLSYLHTALAPYGLAMRNLGSISDQTLSGIVATATHGAGSAFGVMPTHVLALTVLLPSNEVVRCSQTENHELFSASLCGLGATGILLNITLELEPSFNLRDVQTIRPFDQVLGSLDSIKNSGEHVRLWWFPAIGMVRCSVMDRTSEPARRVNSWLWDSSLGFHVVQFMLFLTRFARPLIRPSFPTSLSPSRTYSPFLIPRNFLAFLTSFVSYLWLLLLHLGSRVLAQHMSEANIWASQVALALSGPRQSVTIDRSDRIFNIECRYPQYTTEWAIPADRAEDCLCALSAWLKNEQDRSMGERPHFPIEIRWSAGDDLWLSPANGGKETCWIGIVQFKPYNLPTRYRSMFAEFERVLAAHGGRPHWAKAHHLNSSQLRALYPDLGRFLEVVQKVDPDGLFRNEYIERHLLGHVSNGREFKQWDNAGHYPTPTDWRTMPSEDELQHRRLLRTQY
ncbi:FAD-binding PCMH-type domain-containing protein [Mycena indigotica]|uniref:D-arabinono-1,4-lactone oxidase n=1 Tax=Mycena indigotica TaxID=2126181 RepID=A0A8H6SCR9_9AGAR|nr:FAD-binding PCMH-type domain-containing protein [Mycena indigotica]KAF7297155.1 FAD-binding PCMH-type domain-containing protein [Mycena indigotica]